MNRASSYGAVVLAFILGISSPALAATNLSENGFAAAQQKQQPLPDTLTLAETVTRALQENHKIEAAFAGREAAEEGRKSARGAFGPVLATGYGYDRTQHKPGRNTGLEQDDALYTWSVSVRQNLFAGFATLATYEKTVLQKESAAASLDQAEIDLIAQVQENFFMLLQAKEELTSAEDSLTRLRSQLKVTDAFYRVGLKPRLDLLQAEVDVSQAEDTLLVAQNGIQTQIARLNTLLNLPAEYPTKYVGNLDVPHFGLTFDQCLASAYVHRPDLLIAAQAVNIGREDKRLAASGFYPQVNADFTWATKGDEMNVSGSDLIEPSDFSAWSVGVQAEWTVFEWGRTYYSTTQAARNIDKLVAEEAALRQEVAFEIKSRLLKLNEAEQRIKVAVKGVDQAREAYRMADARYQAQVGTITDVLDAQAKLSAAEATLTSALGDYMISYSKIYAAMGEKKTSF